VRHPWYFLGLVILWTREMDAALLTSAVVLTLYLAIGARLEDNKLVTLYGESYRRYREKVPGLVPLPWRHLSRQDVVDILKERH
jgi:protein-S-isoprenylcysteine O-methyltransferase Ste14